MVILFQVQSFSQYKYLYACVSSYAKEVKATMEPGDEGAYVISEGHNQVPEDIYKFLP